MKERKLKQINSTTSSSLNRPALHILSKSSPPEAYSMTIAKWVGVSKTYRKYIIFSIFAEYNFGNISVEQNTIMQNYFEYNLVLLPIPKHRHTQHYIKMSITLLRKTRKWNCKLLLCFFELISTNELRTILLPKTSFKQCGTWKLYAQRQCRMVYSLLESLYWMMEQFKVTKTKSYLFELDNVWMP